jgi:hypothetical protein
VDKIREGELDLDLKAILPAEVGDEVLLVRKKIPRIFAAGRVKEILT